MEKPGGKEEGSERGPRAPRIINRTERGVSSAKSRRTLSPRAGASDRRHRGEIWERRDLTLISGAFGGVTRRPAHGEAVAVSSAEKMEV
jgi:hypothetical protein